MAKAKQSTGNSNRKLYNFRKIPKTEEKGCFLTFRIQFQQLWTNGTMVKDTAHNQMRYFYLSCHYQYRCRKVGNNVSYSKTYHTVFCLLKLFQLIIGLFPFWLWFADKQDLFLPSSCRLCPDLIFHTILHHFLSVPQTGHSEAHCPASPFLVFQPLLLCLSVIYFSMTAKIKSLRTLWSKWWTN